MINVETRALRAALDLVTPVIERHSPIAVLGSVHAHANGALEFAATDLDVSAQVRVPYQGDEQGPFLIPLPSAFKAAVAAAGGAAMSLDVSDRGYTLRGGDFTRSQDVGFNVEDWPAHDLVMGDEAFRATVPVEALRQLKRVVPAISTEETRYYLNGVFIHHVKDWTWRAVATDGHRLHMVDIVLPGATGDVGAGIILPRKWLNIVLAHMAKSEAPLDLVIGASPVRNAVDTTAPPKTGLRRAALTAQVRNAVVTYQTKEIDGTFPDYKRVVPQSADFTALVPVSQLRRAILCVSAGVSSRPGNAPAMKLTFNPGCVVVGLKYRVEGVSSEYRVECQHNAPDGHNVGFRGWYVLDILNCIPGTDVQIAIDKAEYAPAVFNDVSDPAWRAVLMPMRVSEK